MSTSQRLAILAGQLAALEARTPARARALHGRRLALAGQLEALQGRIALFVKGRELNALESDVAELESLTERLTALVGESERLARRLDGLAAQSAELKDAAVADWFCARRAAIAALLDPLGAQAADAEAIAADRRRLAALESDLPTLETALALFREAEQRCQRVQSPVRIAALSAALPRLAERLVRDGAGPDWSGELQGLLAPLREYASRGKPVELKDLGALIQGLLRWCTALGIACPECERLSEQYTRKSLDWENQDLDVFNALRERAQALERDLLDRAHAQRGPWTADIETQQALLRELDAPDPPLQSAFARLLEAAPEDADGYLAWRRDYDVARARFRDIVSTRRRELEERHARLAEDSAARLAAIERLPRLDAADRERRALAEALASRSASGDTETLLAGLQVLRDLARRIDALDARVRADLDGLKRRLAALQARRDRLAEVAAGLVADAPADLPEIPEAPPPPAGDPRLESAIQSAEQLATGLDRAEREIRRLVADRLAEREGRISAILALLPPDSGLSDSDEAAPLAIDPADPASALPALERARARLAQAEASIGEEQVRQERQRTALMARIAALDWERATPLQAAALRGQAESLAGWPDADSDTDALERLRDLHDRVLGARLALEPLEQTQARIETLRRGLEQRLVRLGRQLPDPDRPESCQDWALRIEGLIAPAPWLQRPAQDEADQLAEAERLLDALERHCRRLAAQRDAADLESLRTRRRRPADPPADALLERLTRVPRHQPIPEALRLELRALIAERQSDGGAGQ